MERNYERGENNIDSINEGIRSSNMRLQRDAVTHGAPEACRSQTMKKMIHTALIMGAILINGCSDSALPVSPAEITHIRITRFPGDTLLAEIADPEQISQMLSTVSYGDKRHLTVKHPLPILIDLYAGTNAVCHVSCEDRMMRIGNWEYTMSRKSAELIQKTIQK